MMSLEWKTSSVLRRAVSSTHINTFGMSNNDRREILNLSICCHNNHLALNDNKTKELIVDFRGADIPVTMNSSPVEIISSFRFQGVKLSDFLSWPLIIRSILKKAQQCLLFLRRPQKFGANTGSILNFYQYSTWSVLTASWYPEHTKSHSEHSENHFKNHQHGSPTPPAD